jgi:hypothetical protein
MESAFSVSVLMALVSSVSASLPLAAAGSDTETASEQYDIATGFLTSKRLEAAGPLRVHPDNPRYFTDNSGRAILLTGSHTWNNLVDMAPAGSRKLFDYDKHLDWLKKHNHNFFRLWSWELMTWDTRGNKEKNAQLLHVSPHPWKRTGPGNAADGKPKFDLQQLNDDYFTRMGNRVAAAQDHGIYPAVMLFEGWGIRFSPDGWKSHPFHPDNNVNGVDGDVDGDGVPVEVHDGSNERIVELQQTYVRRVIDTVNEFDNVLYEITNESRPESTEWQYAMIRFIKKHEQTKPKQHPVGMTFQYKGGDNETLFDSPADWISPNNEGGYRDNPPASEGSKVIIADTDHLWGIGGNADWVWKSFFRGLHPIFMDPVDGTVLTGKLEAERADAIRRGMGQVLEWSRRIDLAAMTPHGELSSTHYCLATPGEEYLVYVPKGVDTVSLELAKNNYKVVWFNSATGRDVNEDAVTHSGGKHKFQTPFESAGLLHVSHAK